MIKAVIEISDLLCKGLGYALIENFTRDFYLRNSSSFTVKVLDLVGMIIYTTMHSFLLTLEMFTLHVALTSSEESVYSFLFYNNFTELKITVFKKVDIPGLYQYVCNDSVERFQLLIYVSNMILTTS
jgi:hypothetical protein